MSLLPDAAAEDAVAKVLLEADDVGALFEFFLDGKAAGGPNLEFGIGVEGAGGFDAELGDAAIKNRVITHFRACEALFVHEDEAVIGEDKEIAEDFKSATDGFAGDEDRGEFGLDLRVVDFSGVAEEVG